MNTLELLVKAKEIIQDPAHWMQQDYSDHVEDTELATCYCSLGALAKAKNPDQPDWFSIHHHPAAVLLKESVGDAIPEGSNFAYFNDERTHAEVMDAFDKAIEKAKLL